MKFDHSTPLPNDSDGDAMRRLLDHGSDLSKPMEIDFAVDVPDGERAVSVAADASRLGFRVHIYHDDKDFSWTCYCTKFIVSTYDTVVDIQKQLDELSRPYGGKSDGWGSFGNAGQAKGDWTL